MGYTVQTLTEPLWGAELLDSPSEAAALRLNILWFTPHPKIHHRGHIKGVPIHARNCSVWQICDDWSHFTLHSSPDVVQAYDKVQAGVQTILHVEGTGRGIILP